jgi:26S proteasome regulatory subunit N10
LISVPAGVSPVNALISSPIMYGAASMGGMGGNMGGGGGNADFDMYGGIDPALDPELAMAIRVSTEEARAQEEARLKAMQEQVNKGSPVFPHLFSDLKLLTGRWR